jgi:predicted KAP-like P-loop ATPase
VNFGDFVGIETLRVFAWEAYDVVRNNPEQFSGSATTSFGGSREMDVLKAFHTAWLDNVPSGNRESVSSLLAQLFPKFAATLGGPVPSSGLEAHWRRELRISSPDIFPVYFRLAPPAGRISAAEVSAFLEMQPDPAQFGSVLVKLADERRPDGSTKARDLLERLTDHIKERTGTSRAPSLIRALFRVGDQLLEKDQAQTGLSWTY